MITLVVSALIGSLSMLIGLEANAPSKTNQKIGITKVTPQMFGAKADGRHDDTESIRKACNSNADTLYFPRGVYLINIPKGKGRSVANNFFINPPSIIIGENKETTIIKLGKDNGDAAGNRGYESIFSFSGKDTFVEVRDITFDFNYKDNPITQYTSNHVAIEQNGQQMAINAYRVASLVVDNCRFIDHSGTNCIIYRANAESDTLYCKICNCRFEKCGQKSFFKGEEAYHDCSTIGFHADTKEQKHKFYCYVENNFFEGIGGNAFDACECSADVFFFRNNEILGYAVGVMPLTAHAGTLSFIENNIFNSVARGVGIWSNNNDVKRPSGTEGFKGIFINNNKIVVAIDRFIHRPSFGNIQEKIGDYYPGGYFGAVCNMGLWSKSIGTLQIANNDIVYDDCSNVPNQYIVEKINLYNGAVVGLYNIFEGKPCEAYCNRFIFEYNKIMGAPTSIIRLTPFNRIDYLSFSNNIIIETWKNADVAVINEGLISIHPAYYGTKEEISWGDFYIQDNNINYPYSTIDYATIFLSSSANNIARNSKLVIRRNNVNESRYGVYRNQTDNIQFKTIVR